MLMDLSRKGLINQGYSEIDAARILQVFIDKTLVCKDMQNLRVTVIKNAMGVIQNVRRGKIK